MTGGSVPSKDGDLLSWSGTFDQALIADPTALFFTPVQAAAYTAAHQAYADALQVATNPATRTRSAVELKQAAKQELLTLARRYVAMIQANADITNAQRLDLNIKVHDTEPTPTPPPHLKPQPVAKRIDGRTVFLEIQDPETSRAVLPAGVAACHVYYYVGEAPAPSPADWKFYAGTSKAEATLVLDSHIMPGTTVWLVVNYLNRKQQTGPASAAIPVKVNFGTPELPKQAA